MVTDKEIKQHRFSWGDEVRVTNSSYLAMRPGKTGSVCGIRLIESEDVAKRFAEPVGTARVGRNSVLAYWPYGRACHTVK